MCLLVPAYPGSPGESAIKRLLCVVVSHTRNCLTENDAKAVASTLFSAQLDCCNSLFFAISKANINKLQLIQNTAHVVADVNFNICTGYRSSTTLITGLPLSPSRHSVDWPGCLPRRPNTHSSVCRLQDPVLITGYMSIIVVHSLDAELSVFPLICGLVKG